MSHIPPILTLLTDFGTRDGFVGAMKGVIKTICPQADIVDITHDVPPRDILAGSMVWNSATRWFPRGTIHVGVVDPGVGSSRIAIAAQIDGHIYICPDNGLLTHVARNTKPSAIVRIESPEYCQPNISRTFHGRDIFAPAGAHVAKGIWIKALGPAISDYYRLSLTDPIIKSDEVTAHITHFDTFGNAWTDLQEWIFTKWAHDRKHVEIYVNGHRVIGPVDSYSSVEPAKAAAIFASHGHLEIAVRNGNARAQLALSIGDEVRLTVPR